MISSVKITKLFGRFNYELKFMPENIMIITGPNGYGKSTILKMINSFCDNNLQKLFTYTFKKFEITCDDCNVAITRNEKSFKINDHVFPYPDDKIINRRGVQPFIRRVGYDEYIDLRTNQIIKMNAKDIFNDRLKEDFQGDRFFELLFLFLEFGSTEKSPQQFEELKKAFSLIKKAKHSIGKIQFIQEQRLIERRRVPEEERVYSEPKEKYVTVINENSEKLKADLAEIMKKHSSLSSELDSTYIGRLLDADISSTHNIQDIMDSIEELRIKQQKLQKYALAEIKNVSDIVQRDTEKLEKYVTVINENSEKLKADLAEIMKKHSSLSSELDSTYIGRLLDADISSTHNIQDIMDSIEELRIKQQKLQKYALAEIKNVSDIVQRDTEKLEKYMVELSIYLKDANEKYDVFENIINKLDLYEEIVNHKLKFKKMKLSRTDGIQVVSDEGSLLSLNDLSSGEQEILVLFFKLIFESDVNLLMIDEPEISLHIAWQKELMNDLRRVIQLNKNIQVIIATHSPQIISNNWDLQIDLGGQYNG